MDLSSAARARAKTLTDRPSRRTPPFLLHVSSSKRRKRAVNNAHLTPDDNGSNSDSSLIAGSRTPVSRSGSVHEKKILDVDASFGDNVLESKGRESTPCSLTGDPKSTTSGSTTRPNTAETNKKIQNSMSTHIPTAQEIDEFFAEAEEKQLRRFIEKYNFDPVNEKPLPGRYEWEKLVP